MIKKRNSKCQWGFGEAGTHPRSLPVVIQNRVLAGSLAVLPKAKHSLPSVLLPGVYPRGWKIYSPQNLGMGVHSSTLRNCYKVMKRVGGKTHSQALRGERQWQQSLWRTICQDLAKLERQIPFNPTIAPLVTHPKKTSVHT